MISKLLWMVPLLLLGCAVAAAYGAVHDQISYTVAPEYFTSFKFHTFRISEDYHNRVGAAFVGVMATWWMGVLIGIPVLIVALILPHAKSYVRHGLAAIGIVLFTAMLVGLGGLAYQTFAVSPAEASAPLDGYPAPILDPAAFRRVGALHNASYLGGAVGLVVALLYLLVMGWRLKASAPRHEVVNRKRHRAGTK